MIALGIDVDEVPTSIGIVDNREMERRAAEEQRKADEARVRKQMGLDEIDDLPDDPEDEEEEEKIEEIDVDIRKDKKKSKRMKFDKKVLEDTFGPGFKMSDDFAAQMQMGGMGGFGNFEDMTEGDLDEEVDEHGNKRFGRKEEVKVDTSSYRMERDDNLKFTETKYDKMDDISHLFKQEGNSVYMITQEQYDKEQAEAKAMRKERRRKKKEAEQKLKAEKIARGEPVDDPPEAADW